MSDEKLIERLREQAKILGHGHVAQMMREAADALASKQGEAVAWTSRDDLAKLKELRDAGLMRSGLVYTMADVGYWNIPLFTHPAPRPACGVRAVGAGVAAGSSERTSGFRRQEETRCRRVRGNV